MDSRLSYLYASDNRMVDDELVKMFNPILNLSETFNSLVGEEGSHLHVFLRVRPVLPGEEQQLIAEDSSSEEGQVRLLDDHTVLLTAPPSSNTFRNTSHGITKLTHKFSFSHVYGPMTSQVELFDCTTKAMVGKFINGQNCLLFTYGATNSGKTHTVQGGSGTERGLLPRTLDGLFSSIRGRLYPRRDLKPHYYCALASLDEREARQEEEKKEALFRSTVTSGLSRPNASVNSSAESSRPPSPDVCASVCSTDRESSAVDISQFSEDDCVVATEEGLVYAVFVTFVEIYNETVYDLLERLPPGAKKRNAHLLGEDRNGSSYIKGLHDVRVDSADEALRVLEIGRQNLHFATTRLNHNSSRSHCIFTVKLVHLASIDKPKFARVSMFSVCDLAGAERVGKTQGTGDRLKEAGSINSSLLVLSRCIVALRQNQMSQRGLLECSSASAAGAAGGRRREVPVPFRDSKLTRLLQSFFLGQGVAAMIVNISQAPALFDETLQVLKFSAIAKKVITCQEQPVVPVAQPVRQSNSHLSRLIRQSLNKSFSRRGQRSSAALMMARDSSSGAGRLSVPWANKTTGRPNDTSVNMTFGEDPKEEPVLTVMEEEEDEDEEEDERIQMLLDHMNKLSEALRRINTEKKELEVRLRHELCSEFSKQLIEVEADWRDRLETEQARSAELHDWRIAKLTEYYTATTQPRKRPRTEDGSPGDLDSSGDLLNDTLQQYRNKAREELEAQLEELQERLSARDDEAATLLASLKKSTETGNKAQEEATKLTFQLATLTTSYDALKAQLESVQKVASSAVPATEALSALERQLRASEQTVSDLSTELQENREMLVEAAEAYTNKEEQVEALAASLGQRTHKIAEQTVSLQQAADELSAAQQLTSEHMATLQERETALEDALQQASNLKQTVRQLREEAVLAQKFAVASREKEAQLVRDKSRLLVEVAEMQNKLQAHEQRAEELRVPFADVEGTESRVELLESNKCFQDDLEEKEALLLVEKRVNEELSEKLKEMKDDLLRNQDEAEQELAAVKEQLSCVSDDCERLKRENSLMMKELEVLKEKVSYYRELRDEAQVALETLSATLSALRERHQKLAEVDEGKGEQTAHLNAQLQQVMEQLENNNRTTAELREQLKKNKTNCEQTEKQLMLQLEEAEQREAGKLAELKLLEGRFSKSEEEIFSLRSSTTTELAEATEKLKLKETELKQLKEQLADRAENAEKQNVSNKHVVAMNVDLVKELQSTVDALILQNKSVINEKDTICAKYEDAKKNHVAALRYRDCELVSAHKEATDARQQLTKLREERDALLLRCAELEKRTNEAVDSGYWKHQLEQSQSKMLRLEYRLEEQQKVIEALKFHEEALDKLKEELKCERSIKEVLEAERAGVLNQLEDSERKLSELNAAVIEMNERDQQQGVDKDKIEKMKEDLKKSREMCLVLQKEASAMREARSVEVDDVNNLRAQVSSLQLTCQQREEEITMLQAEVKKALNSAVISNITPISEIAAAETAQVSIKQEVIDAPEQVSQREEPEENLRELIRAREAEVLELQQQLSAARDHSVMSLPNTTTATSHVTATALTVNSSSTSESSHHDDTALPPPAPLSSRQRVRCRTVATCSDSDNSISETPAKPRRMGRPKTLQARPPPSPQGSEGSRDRSDLTENGLCSARRSTRRTRVPSSAATTALLTTTDEGGDVDDAEDDWEPEVAPALATGGRRRGGASGASSSKRSTRTKKAPPRLYNPHLDNQENRSGVANQCDSVNGSLLSVSVDDKSTTSRSRRRRPLYTEVPEEPLHCSPQLVDPLPPMDSPHTVVRRKLRTKAK